MIQYDTTYNKTIDGITKPLNETHQIQEQLQILINEETGRLIKTFHEERNADQFTKWELVLAILVP